MACGEKGDVNWGGGWAMVSGTPPDADVFGAADPRPARAPRPRARWGAEHTWQLVALLIAAAFLIYRARRS